MEFCQSEKVGTLGKSSVEFASYHFGHPSPNTHTAMNCFCLVIPFCRMSDILPTGFISSVDMLPMGILSPRRPLSKTT